MNQNTPIKRALLSVSEKTGIVPFAKGLRALGVEILSTGGTAKRLKDNGVDVTDVFVHTGFPEMFDGRVKTLHPKVHGGILQRRDNEEDQCNAARHSIPAIDIVVVNLYPFQETIVSAGVTLKEAIDNIDIGGPAMLRSAAKNFRWVTVVSEPSDYNRVLTVMQTNSGCTTLDLRKYLAQKVFGLTKSYDAAIHDYLFDLKPNELKAFS